MDVFLRNLRTKTVRAIIDHITDTIPVPGEGLWDVLSVDYTKCLTSLVRYAPHNEHLGDAEWEKLIEFCLAVINTQEGDESQLSIRGDNRSPEDLLDANNSRSTPVRLTTPAPAARRKSASNININSIGEVVECVQLLTVSPSAPVQAAAETILQALVEFVKTSPAIAGNMQQLAFTSINAVALKILFDQSDLVRSSTLELIPVVRRLWPTKLPRLRDELLITMMVWTVVLFDEVQEDPSETVTRSIEDLVDTLHSEYLKRPEKDLLQIDDITLDSTPVKSNRPIYGPRLGSSRSEHNWTVLWSIANLSKLSGKLHIHTHDNDVADDKPSKRRRFNSEADDIFRDAVSATGTRRVCALQLVPLLVNERSIEQKEDLIQRLVPNILDDNSAVSSWTMVALARLVWPISEIEFLSNTFSKQSCHWLRRSTTNIEKHVGTRYGSFISCDIFISHFEGRLQSNGPDPRGRPVGKLCCFGLYTFNVDVCEFTWALFNLRRLVKPLGLHSAAKNTIEFGVCAKCVKADMQLAEGSMDNW